jgi:hypothetical protein
MSSIPPIELRPEPTREELSRWLDRKVISVKRIGGGLNSQVYKVATDGEKGFALKVYFRHPQDKRDRLAGEYGSFSYLWANGFREIPRPVTSDPHRGWAVYQFIEGDKIPRGQVSDAELTIAADFLGRLRELSRKKESLSLGTASEAFFAANLIADNVRQRLQRLEAIKKKTAPHQSLRSFLKEEFKPFLELAGRWSESRLEAAGMSYVKELSRAERTLSPSDFGFHNALRQPDGRIIFLDFEYFGWDDPAKMIVDFLLHPAMDFSLDGRKKFASAMFHRFPDWPGLIRRVEGVYPLFGLKWCMILLNEFLPDQLLRRQFAATAATDRSALQRQQLGKARQMLERIRREYECFPYHD